MKKIAFVYFMAAALLSCSQSHRYTIEGTVESGKDSSVVYLAKLVSGVGVVPVDSTLLIDGRFSFKGEQDTAAIRFIFYHNEENILKNCMIVLEEADLKVHLGKENVAVEGTEPNLAVRNYYDDMKRIAQKYQMMQAKIMNDTTMGGDRVNELTDGMAEAMEKEVKSMMMNHLIKNAGNPLGAYLLKSLYTTLDAEAILPLFDEIPPLYRDEEWQQARQYVTSSVQRAQADEKTASGKMYVDFEMADSTGKTRRLSESVATHKVTFVYFWAGWHKACINNMPEIIRVYEKYKDKGLEWVGISLDNNAETWKEALKTCKVPGVQLSDLKGGYSAAAQLYGIVYIPSMMLIGEDGIILSKNLKADSLEVRIQDGLGLR